MAVVIPGRNFYAPGSENSELTAIMNGTGPYMLESWTPGEGWVWLPTKTTGVVMTNLLGRWSLWPTVSQLSSTGCNEWGTRFASLQAGDAECVAVPIANRPQADQFVGEFCDYPTGDM